MEFTLEYWNTLAKQLILISSLLSGFSIAVVVNIMVNARKDRLMNRLLKAATLAAGSFLVTVFSMFQIAMMTTPGGYWKNVVAADFALPRTMGAATFIVGLLSLTVVISWAGWTKSRQVGRFTTVVGIATLILILLTMV
ncbi:MAG TPA: hypothetical protein DCE41_30330 [Cytophagales bacterium]|nr:hypothetical protein [Cytophagales bacterium]HAA20385.1 hypothetical protein [Cytophagales bacterium]HAP62141.1 hypothetical protein [Cytophagales bacterium]